MGVGLKERPIAEDMSLAELAERVKAGDTEVQEVFYQKLFARGVSLAVLAGASEHDAQDIAQEVYLRGWNGLAGFDGDKFDAWYATIVRNTTRDLHRKNKRLISRMQELTDNVEDSGPTPEKQAMISTMSGILNDGIATLTPQESEAFTLRHITDMKFREVADKMKVSESAAKTYAQRGKEKLKKYILARIDKDNLYGVAFLPFLTSMLERDIADGFIQLPGMMAQATATGAVATTGTATASTAATTTGIGAKFAALGVGAKTAIVAASAAVVVTSVAVPVYVHNENQRAEAAALVLQQEQEAEQSRIAFEAEQSRIAEEKAEAERVAAEEAAEASQAAADAAAASEAAAQSEAEAQAASEAAAQSQPDTSIPAVGGGQSSSSAASADDIRGGFGGSKVTEEPAGGCPDDRLQNPVWDSSVGGWRGTINGQAVIVMPSGNILIVDDASSSQASSGASAFEEKWNPSGKSEPAGGCPNSTISNPKWDSDKGAWRGTDGLGESCWVFPNGTISYG